MTKRENRVKIVDVRYILFDLDGTLVDSSEGIVNCFRHAFMQMRREPPSEATLRACIGPPLLDSFLHFFGGDRALALRGVTLYRERYGALGWRECRLYAGVREGLAALRGRGKILGVATSKPQPFAERILEHFSLYDDFSVVVGSKEDNSFDKKGDIIRLAMSRLGAPRAETAMIGDRRHDIAGAKENGIFSVGIQSGFSAPGELEAAGADFVTEDFLSACIGIIRSD